MAQSRRLAAVLFLAIALGVAVAAVVLARTANSRHRAQLHVVATPTAFMQVRRAAEVGPGFLNYCPTHNGRLRARYDINLPGAPRAGGWCETRVIRRRGTDLVTFRAHWQEIGINPRNGTLVLTYSVPQTAVPKATPVAQLVRQAGEPPP